MLNRIFGATGKNLSKVPKSFFLKNVFQGQRRQASTVASPSKWASLLRLTVGIPIAAAFGVAYQGLAVVEAASPAVDYNAVKKDIAKIIEKDDNLGPTFVRLAWHAAGTYSAQDKSGGSDGGRIRHEPEASWGANAGLHIVRKELESVKAKHPGISYADLYTLSGIVAVEELGGPKVPWRPGRVDHADGKTSPPDGRLPGADKGSKQGTIDHVRDVFYRMGFNDQEIVALLGAHALGRCHTDRSGYDGPWTKSPTSFSNWYYRELLDNKWTVRKWNGPLQYEDPEKSLMMLPADIAFIWDDKFRKHVEAYAKDEQLFFNDFAKAFSKLLELGVKSFEKK